MPDEQAVSYFYAEHLSEDNPDLENAKAGKLLAVNSDGRPSVLEQRAYNYSGLSSGASKVLYALAVAELCGITLGLNNRSIRKILHYTLERNRDQASSQLAEAEIHKGRVGRWDWLFDEDLPFDASSDKPSEAVVRNGLQEIFNEYPFLILAKGQYVAVQGKIRQQRSKGGQEPDVYKFGESLIAGWPCTAAIVMLLLKELGGAHRTTVLDLKLRVAELIKKSSSETSPDLRTEHPPYIFPDDLFQLGFPRKPSHSVEVDLEFLLRTRYIKLFKPERSNKKGGEATPADYKEIAEDFIVQPAARANWEVNFLDDLARHSFLAVAKRAKSAV